MSARRLGLGLALLAATAVGLTCGDSSGPVAGPLNVVLTTPNPGADGAMILTVAGPAALTGVSTPLAGGRAFTDTLGTTTKIIVTGTLGAGVIVTIQVEDVGQVANYTAAIQQVAQASYALRTNLTGYSLSVSR